MNTCLSCGKIVNNKFCNVSCQNKFQSVEKNNKRFGALVKFNVICNSCNTQFLIEEREKLFPQKEKYYCSRSCANKRVHSLETKKKLSIKNKQVKIIHCEFCNIEFEQKKINQRFCNQSCSTKSRMPLKGFARIGGLSSVKSQNKRSKNEIYFASLCEKHFNFVQTNVSMFNGWDADVIINDIKLAILWNGIWHYKKITNKHSVKQVQNRDEIKMIEIRKFGYEPYIIKDLGKFNKSFVEEEFKKLIEYSGVV